MRQGAFVRKYRFSFAACALALTLWSAELVVNAQTSGPNVAGAGGISFSSLSGPNLAAYTGHTEGDFTIIPTAGTWQQALAYGNPVPSILDGPTNAPGIAVLLITDNVDLFTFGALDFSSNNGNSSYDIQGYLGANLQFHETGTLLASFSPFSFKTLLSSDPALQVDSLLIEVIPGSGVTSINLDNIKVATIPEPDAVILLVAGLVALGSWPRAARGKRRSHAVKN